MILAALSAYFALTPLIYSAQKTRQMKEDTQAFYEQAKSVKKEQEPQRTNPNDHVPIPYENLYLDMRDSTAGRLTRTPTLISLHTVFPIRSSA